MHRNWAGSHCTPPDPQASSRVGTPCRTLLLQSMQEAAIADDMNRSLSKKDKRPLQACFAEHDFSSAPLEVTLDELKAQFGSAIGFMSWKFTELAPGESLQEHVQQRPKDDPMWPQQEVCSANPHRPAVSPNPCSPTSHHPAHHAGVPHLHPRINAGPNLQERG